MNGGFFIDSEWYWRIFEAQPCFALGEADRVARDFLRPLAFLARDQVEITDIVVDADGNGVQFRIAALPIALRCAGLRVEHFIAEINRGLAAAELDLAFALVESRRYELRGVLVPRREAQHRVFARGTLPPTPRRDL